VPSPLDRDIVIPGPPPLTRAELNSYFPVIHNFTINSYHHRIYSSHIFTFLDFIFLCSVLSLFSENCSQTSCFPFNICAFDFSFLKSDTSHLPLLNFILLISDPFFNLSVFFSIQICFSKVFAAPPTSTSYTILKSFLHIPSSELKILNKPDLRQKSVVSYLICFPSLTTNH